MSQDNTTSWIIGGAAAGVGAWVLYRMANKQPILPGATLNTTITPVSHTQSTTHNTTASRTASSTASTASTTSSHTTSATQTTQSATHSTTSSPHLYNGALFRPTGSGKVYLYQTSDNQLHYICSYATFTNMHLDANSIQTVSTLPATVGTTYCDSTSTQGSALTKTSSSTTSSSSSTSHTASGVCPYGYFRMYSVIALQNVCVHAAPATFPGNQSKGASCTTWVGLGPVLHPQTHQPISGYYGVAKYQSNKLASVYVQSSPASLNSIFYSTFC